jgi:hypothetical protein
VEKKENRKTTKEKKKEKENISTDKKKKKKHDLNKSLKMKMIGCSKYGNSTCLIRLLDPNDIHNIYIKKLAFKIIYLLSLY